MTTFTKEFKKGKPGHQKVTMKTDDPATIAHMISEPHRYTLVEDTQAGRKAAGGKAE